MRPSDTLTTLLSRLGAEVTSVADLVRSIDVGSRSLEAGGRTRLTDADLVDLQKLDLAEQTLRSLAFMLGEIALSDAGAATIQLDDVMHGLPLHGLADRLRGVSPMGPTDSGALDLF